MFGKKIIISIIMTVILISTFENLYVVTAVTYDIVAEELEPTAPVMYSVNNLVEFYLYNYIFITINIVISIINRKKYKKYFRNILIITVILAIFLVIGQNRQYWNIGWLDDIFCPIFNYNVNALNHPPTTLEKIKFNIPTFTTLILQIIISINIILKLRTGKNQPKCEKA